MNWVELVKKVRELNQRISNKSIYNNLNPEEVKSLVEDWNRLVGNRLVVFDKKLKVYRSIIKFIRKIAIFKNPSIKIPEPKSLRPKKS